MSGVSPTSAADAVINNSSAVTVNGTAVAHSLTLNNSTVIVSGALTLGTSLTVDGGAYLKLGGGTLSAQSIVSDSGTSGSLFGYGTIGGAVSGGVNIWADGGTLKVQGSLAGDQGALFIDSGATLELSNGSANEILFNGNLGTLKLDAPTAFTGPIYTITLGDTIDLAGITASSASYSGSTLTINENNGQQLSYSVSGSVAGDILTVASDNNGGTDIYWSEPQPSVPPVAASVYWITGASGDWSTGSDWLSGVAPSSTDDAVINNSFAVTVNGTAVAHSLAMNNSTLTVGGTLTLGTSLTLDAVLVLSGGTLSAQSITCDSNTASELRGYGTVSGAVSGVSFILADGGTLKIEGSLAGFQGYFDINQGATLELSNGTAAPVYVGLGTLKLDVPSAFTGSIPNIVVGSTIDLVGITANSATYSGSTLTINETNGQHLTYNVSGSVAGDTVTVASDNNGGTDIYWGSTRRRRLRCRSPTAMSIWRSSPRP